MPLLVLSACGGQVEEAGARPEESPTVAVLAAPGGPEEAALRAGRIDEARAQLEGRLAKDPEQLAALNDLAVSYALEGRDDAARSLLDDVVTHGSSRDQQLALVNLGELYGLEGYPDAAKAHLETARSIDPQRPEPLYALALLADVRGDSAKGVSLAREALRLDESGEGRASLAFLRTDERIHLEALLAEARGDPAGALASWRELRSSRYPSLAAAAQRRLGE